MKYACLLLTLFCFFQTTNIQAETFVIGKQQFSYSVPEGYIQLQKGRSKHEDSQIEYLDSASRSTDSALIAIIAEKDVSYAHLAEGSPMQEYVTLLYSRGMADIQCPPGILDSVKDVMLENVSQRILEEKKADIKDISRQHLQAELEFSTPAKPVVLAQSDTALSLLSSIVVTSEGVKNDVLVLTSILLQRGKLVFVNYYKRHTAPDDVENLKKNATAFLAALDVRPVGDGGDAAGPELSSSAASSPDDGFQVRNSGSVMYALAAGVLALLLLILVRIWRKKKKENR